MTTQACPGCAKDALPFRTFLFSWSRVVRCPHCGITLRLRGLDRSLVAFLLVLAGVATHTMLGRFGLLALLVLVPAGLIGDYWLWRRAPLSLEEGSPGSH